MALALLLLHQQQLARQHGARAVAVVLRCAGSSSGSDSSSCGLRQHQQLLQQTSRLHTSSSTDALQHAVPELGLFSAGAAALDALHSLSGLPWWAVIPAAAVGIKTLLLPLSLKQAKIVRTNMVLWSEAHEFQRQQETRRQRLRQEQQEQGATQQHQHQQQQQQQQQAPAHAAGQSSTEAAATTLQQLQQWQGRLQLYHSLRRKCGVPHPAWFLVNSSLQFPIFIYAAASIRSMAQADWPGFSSEGALWFADLTQPAMRLVDAGLQLPMGLPGLVLPLAATGVMLTSIHLGFKASGAAAKHPSVAGTWLAMVLANMRPVLYALTIASAAIKVQLPQAAVLHWTTTASYTLGLQLGLKSPRVRQLLGYSQPGAAGSGSTSGAVDPGVVAQVAAMDNADVLVVMGAKHAALQRYSEARHCLARALQLDPNNARAHYSLGQIHALQQQWQQSQDGYSACAALSTDPQARAQALYCAGVACHQQGRHKEALQAFQQAAAAGPPSSLQAMLVLGSARALQGMGQPDEAAAAARQFLAGEHAQVCPQPVAEALRSLAAGAPCGSSSEAQAGGA